MEVIGELPLPLGYGVTVSHDNSLYLIGGKQIRVNVNSNFNDER